MVLVNRCKRVDYSMFRPHFFRSGNVLGWPKVKNVVVNASEISFGVGILKKGN
jgi:hypothetical protein